MSFLGVIGSVEKFPLVDLQLYFLIFKPIDPVGMKVSLVLGHLPALGRVSKPIS